MKFALDSRRKIDSNGFLHVSISNISKECVNPYYGYEIPNYKQLGFDRNTIYYALRKGEELEKASTSFNGLPLLRGHYVEHASNPQKEHRVGSLGTECKFMSPYLQNSIIVTDQEAINKIESGERLELSAAYSYIPLLEKGVFEGQNYDFIMTEIKGNHVALVEEGRAGPDIVVADEKISITQNSKKISSDISEDDDDEIQSSSKKVCEDLEKFSKENNSESLEVFKSEQDNIKECLNLISQLSQILNKFLTDNTLREVVSDKSLQDVGLVEKNQHKASETAQNFNEMLNAMQNCIPLTGEMDFLAFDSADEIYVHACKLLNINASKASAKDVIMALIKQNNLVVNDRKNDLFQSRFL